MTVTATPITSFDVSLAYEHVQAWFFAHVLTADTFVQGILLLCAFVAGFLMHQGFKTILKNRIESSGLTSKGKRVARNLARLLLPFTTLLILFLLTQLAASDLVGVDVWLIHCVMKALLAWIVIRAAAQFINNAPVRNSFSFVIWCVAALSIFGILDEAAILLDKVGMDIGTFRLSLLAVIKSIFLLFVLVYTASATASILEQRLNRTKQLSRTSQVLLAKIIRIVLIVMALLVAVTASGIDLSLFAVFGGAIGLGIGFGLQKGIGNLFSGMMLLLDKSIKPGDIIELENGTYGLVQQMAARYTEVVTADRRSYLIPNEELITQRVINWSHHDTQILVSVNFGVHYESDPHQVLAVALKAAQKPSRVLKNQKPICFMTEFGDSAINFRLSFWIDDPENGIGNIKGEVLLALWDAFKDNGIQIPYPHREVFIHKVD